MDLFFVLKLLIVLFFLVMFLRNSRVVWGIGLLTASTAFLLDTIWTTFGREEIIADVGFFFYILAGGLFAGAAIWFWNVLRPLVNAPAPATAHAPAAASGLNPLPPATETLQHGNHDGVDTHQLHSEILSRLSPEDVNDLIFDLQLNENELLAPQQPFAQTVTRIVNRAVAGNQLGALALAVERILTPVPPQSLPRPEKLTISSPPTVLRHYLLAHYSLHDLRQLARRLDVDYEHFEHATKSQLARNLLRYLQQRNQLGRLISQLHAGPQADTATVAEAVADEEE